MNTPHLLLYNCYSKFFSGISLLCVQWTEQEKAAVHEKLQSFLHLGRAPGKEACDEAKEDSRLNKWPWQNMKCFVKNCNESKRRK